MMHSASLYKLIGIVLVAFLFIPQTALADDVTVSNNGDDSNNSVSVNQHTSGQSTVCVNGQCTTEGGDNKSTVCINGQCTTSDDDNVDMQSPDGHDQVHIHSNTGGNSVTPETTENPVSETPEPTISDEPSMTPDPTIVQMRKDINNQVQKQVDAVKEHVKEQNGAIASFIKDEIDVLSNFLNGLFK